MSRSIFTIKQGDTEPKIRSVLSLSGWEPVTFAGASVAFVYKNITTGGAAVRRTGTLVSYTSTTATVEYAWVSGDTTTSGTLDAEWEITLASGAIITFPNGYNLTVIVTPDIR